MNLGLVITISLFLSNSASASMVGNNDCYSLKGRIKILTEHFTRIDFKEYSVPMCSPSDEKTDVCTQQWIKSVAEAPKEKLGYDPRCHLSAFCGGSYTMANYLSEACRPYRETLSGKSNIPTDARK